MIKRREFLQGAAVLAATLLVPEVLALPSHKRRVKPRYDRVLRLHNLHTDERLVARYVADGYYQPDELLAINRLLRDHRSDEVTNIDYHLLDQLYILQFALGKHRNFEVISAYRSPNTNQHLFKTTSGVAKKSLHMQGRAIDVRLAGVDLNRLRKAALAMQAGGVGYYPESNFLHLDTGRYRYW